MPRIAKIIAAQYPHHITLLGSNWPDVFSDDEERGKSALDSFLTKKIGFRFLLLTSGPKTNSF